jgi:hypothetical protein
MPTSSYTIAGVLDALFFHGERAATSDKAPDLIIEVPHGATHTRDFRAFASLLTSTLPADLVDFFHVNTDAGAPELAEAIARELVRIQPARSLLVIRCRIPRTFIDCNRRIDAKPEEFREGKVTPGLMPWITTEADRLLLRGRYDDYVSRVHALAGSLRPDGAMLLLHTYAPRSVDVEVDHDIVAKLRQAWLPQVETTWPLRPEVDVIARSTDGTSLAPADVVNALRAELGAIGIPIADSATYPLHPSTLAWGHVTSHPGRALCVEVRRDLLADPWEPFSEMHIGAEKVSMLATAFAAAIGRWWD